MNMTKKMHRKVVALIAASLACLAGAASQAQTKPYPSEPFTLIVPFGAGGGTDLLARHIGKAITGKTGLAAIVENKAGANGIIGAQHAKKATANGYNILLTTSTTHGANPSLYKSLPYDPVADFDPIGLVGVGGVVMVVKADSRINNVQDFIAAAKASPRPMTFGSGNSSSQAGGELLKSYVGVDLMNVPYKSVPAALTDLVGGQVDVVFADSIAAQPMITGGQVKPIGVSTRTRIPGLENVPTIAEQGVQGYEFLGWIAAYTPKGVPEDRRKYLNAMFNDIVKEQAVADFLARNGWIVQPGTMEEMDNFQKSEIAKWRKIVETTGMTVQ
ncbi:tripartite tricarboxylate transporter family receptor [Bordetella bronchiseptica MO211]|nr:tripartite tricarboxylate transporter family receptor [Bordetella bronchiseptica MO211]